MLKNCFIVLFLFSTVLAAQQKDTLQIKNGIDKPNILSIHHFGIFSSRINQNFKITPNKATTFSVNYASGNIFHPFLETYLPKDPQVRKEQSRLVWFHRNFHFIDQETTPADYINIVVDAVIKELRLNLDIPLNKKNELGISLRSHLITKGKYPFSFFASDETIEWFHTNIFGGEDPFGRRYYGLNQVNLKYTDRNGNIMTFNNNDFLLSGIEFNHHYYPSFSFNSSKNIHLNFGSHLGINTSKYNPSIDIGISMNGVKKITLKNNNEFNIGVGLSALRKNLVTFNEAIDLGNNRFLGSAEADIEYTKYTKKRNYHAWGFNYQIQTRYNKLEEASYYRLIGKWEEINGGWQHGISTLYKTLSNWTFIYTYGRPNYKLSLYFKEDLSVNNAPDLQTGIGLQIPVSK